MAEAKPATGMTVDPRVNTIRNVLTRGIDQLKLVMSKEMNPERMIRIAVNAASRNPTLASCSPQSIGLALITASQMGLEPNGRDAHLVPFWNSKAGVYEATFMPDYKGLIKLAYRSGQVAIFDAKAVRANDLFDFEYGSDQYLKHKPAIKERGELICAWAMVKMKDNDAITFVVLDQEAILKRKSASQSGRKDSGPWHDWEDEMWAKTAVKALAKLVPLGDEFERAVDHDEAHDSGVIPAASVSLNLPTEDVPPPSPKPGPEPGTESAAIDTTATAKPEGKADQAAAAIRQKTQQRKETAKPTTKAPAKQQELPAQEPPATEPAAEEERPTYQPDPDAPVHTGDPNDPTPMPNENASEWAARVTHILDSQKTRADVDFLEQAALKLAGSLLTGTSLKAIERKAQEMRDKFESVIQDAGSAEGPPTEEEADAMFKEFYDGIRGALTLEDLNKVFSDPKRLSRLRGEDLEMLEKQFHRRKEQLSKPL